MQRIITCLGGIDEAGFNTEVEKWKDKAEAILLQNIMLQDN